MAVMTPNLPYLRYRYVGVATTSRKFTPTIRIYIPERFNKFALKTWAQWQKATDDLRVKPDGVLDFVLTYIQHEDREFIL